MILGISCGRPVRSEPGAGMSEDNMASAEPFSKRSDMRVLNR